MKSAVLIILSILIFTGCGKKVSTLEGKQLSIAAAQVNSRQYEEAIVTLEALVKENPDKSIKVKLAHAYAGAAGYETMSFALTLEKLGKKRNSKWEKLKVREILEDVVKMMEPIPTLSKKQKNRLNQSISLYTEMGFNPYNATKEINFKWGVLHTYRLMINLKELIVTYRAIAFEEIQMSNEEIEKLTIKTFKSFSEDFFESYLLYVNSYQKLQNIGAKFEEMLQKTAGNKILKLELSKTAKNHIEFIQDFLKVNYQFTAVLLRKALKLYEVGDYQLAIKEMISSDLPNEGNIKDSERKISILLETFVKNTMTDHPIIDYTITKIFSKELESEVKKAIDQSIDKESTKPLKALFSSKSPEITLVRGCFEIFIKEAKGEGLFQPISEELNSLRKYVDDEDLRRKSQVLANDAGADSEVLKIGGEAALSKDQQLLDEEAKRLDADAQRYDNIGQPIDEFSQELNIEKDEDYNSAKKIAEQVDSIIRK